MGFLVSTDALRQSQQPNLIQKDLSRSHNKIETIFGDKKLPTMAKLCGTVSPHVAVEKNLTRGSNSAAFQLLIVVRITKIGLL